MQVFSVSNKQLCQLLPHVILESDQLAFIVHTVSLSSAYNRHDQHVTRLNRRIFIISNNINIRSTVNHRLAASLSILKYTRSFCKQRAWLILTTYMFKSWSQQTKYVRCQFHFFFCVIIFRVAYSGCELIINKKKWKKRLSRIHKYSV